MELKRFARKEKILTQPKSKWKHWQQKIAPQIILLYALLLISALFILWPKPAKKIVKATHSKKRNPQQKPLSQFTHKTELMIRKNFLNKLGYTVKRHSLFSETITIFSFQKKLTDLN